MFGISALNPLLLWGGLAVAAPIIIHLLSKRRFKIVDWAAMDFLLEADKRNRKRVRLEQLILLLLRCLAILLIAFMVARPFFKDEGLGAMVTGGAAYERIIVLDDSPSMQLNADGKITFDETKKGLVQFVRDLSRERSRDTFSLWLTSQPEGPVIDGEPLIAGNVEDIVATVENLKVSDLSSQLDGALLEIERGLEDVRGSANQMIYIISDMRRVDWQPPGSEGEAGGEMTTVADAGNGATAGNGAAATGGDTQDAAGIIKRLRDRVQDVFIVDVGPQAPVNLTVVDVRSKSKSLAERVDAEFEVIVRNNGTTPAEDVEVTFRAGDSVELKSSVRLIAPGTEEAVPFNFEFREAGSIPVVASVTADGMPADNQRYFAARVTRGIRVLLVNGDPAADPKRSETYFLHVAFNPRDEKVPLGFVVDEVNENQFEAMDISQYQAVVLCNLYRVTDDRKTALERWVGNGGGLMIFLGDQVDDIVYNQQLYGEAGKGLLPAKLDTIAGDETEKTWTGFTIEDTSHPVWGTFADEALRPLVGLPKIFQWWQVIVDKDQLAAGQVAVPLRYTDPQASPAFVEKRFGNGRVVLCTTTVDKDWTDWPVWAPSYLPVMAEYTSFVARSTVGEGTSATGTPIRHSYDPAKFDVGGTMTQKRVNDAGELETVKSTAVEAAPDEEQKRMVIHFAEAKGAGFYDLKLTPIGSDSDERQATLLFAANVDAEEGKLARVDTEDLQKKLGDKVKLVKGQASLEAGAAGARAEFWRPVLIALVAVLLLEQFLAWTFGKRRG